ncbi:hypothetical protein [Streptomyces sp. NPDC059489]|uniref:hypothetical protein n=1 Tax=Streptomyces sp. NPDC059489 TaxID=3346849 RepID=UPI00367C798B
MGWSSANGIFDPVARSLQNAGVDDATKRKVLGDLICGLQDGDWDTEDESLEEFLGDPAIVAAFHDRNVHLSDGRCCQRTAVIEAQERITKALVEHFGDGRGVTAREAAQVAIDAVRDLIGQAPS